MRLKFSVLLSTLAGLGLYHYLGDNDQVLKVLDGDTLVLGTEAQPRKIRLTEIDAPESRQPYGKQSQESLAKLCLNAKIRIEEQGTDRYGRTLGRVFCNEQDANAQQVQLGMAWVYDQYVKDKSLYQLQTAAQHKRIGLWAQTNPQQPWLWRREQKISN